jgi:hypothetical protein
MRNPYISDNRNNNDPPESASFPFERIEENRIFEERTTAGNMMVSGQKLSAWVAEIDGEAAVAATSLFNTRTDAIASADIPATQLALRTAGYSAVGDGGAGLYKRMATAPSDPSNAGYFRSVDRFTSAGVEDATNGGYWSLVPEGGVRVWLEQFGGKGDTSTLDAGVGTDNSTPMTHAMNYLRLDPFGVAHAGGSAWIMVGAGKFYFSQPITLNKTTHIEGHTATNSPSSGIRTAFIWPAGTSGIIGLPPTTVITNGSTFRHLWLHCRGHGGQTTKHGIDMNCKMHIDHCTIYGFGGNGVNIFGDVSGGSNCNQSTVSYCSINENAGHGVRCQGGDSNACVGYFLNLNGNGGYGIYDASFLGNTWIGCHTDGNANAYYLGGVSQRSVIIGCYAEGNQGLSYAGSLSMWFGGLHQNGIDIQAGSNVWVNNTISGGHVLGGGDDITVTVRQEDNSIWEILTPGPEFKLKYVPNNGMVWAVGESLDWAFAISSGEGTNFQNGRGELVSHNRFHLPTGLYLGGPDAGLTGCRLFAGFTPSSWTTTVIRPDSYARGDILLNREPSVSTNTGYVCTTAGGIASAWVAGTSSYVYYGDAPKQSTFIKNAAGRYYRCTGTGAGVTANEPVHTVGTVTEADGYSWLWITDTTAVFKRWGAVMGERTLTGSDDPIFNTLQTWNNAATTFRGFKQNITMTAAATASMLMDLQVDSATKFNVSRYGGMTVTTGSLTSTEGSKPVLAGTQTWNDAGTTFRGIDLNITNTASAAASKMLDLRVAGSTKFNVDTTGAIDIATGTLTTASNPVLSATQTWNDGAVAFKGIELNITNTASAATAKLLDLQVAGTTKFNADVDGDVAAAGVVTAKSATATTAGGVQAIGLGTTAALGIYYGSGAPTISAGKGSLYLRSDGSGVSDRMYVNTDAGTTWTAVTTAA